jgi:5-methylcytosine-specific restriction endonuclease McrA
MPWVKTPEDRKQDSQRYGPAWRKARTAALARAGHRCELGLPGCTTRATTVDHEAGAGNDPAHRHLRALCQSCHGKVTAQQGGGYRAGVKPDPAPSPRTQW